MRILKKLAVGAAMIAALVGGTPQSKAAEGSLEVMAGQVATTIDLKVSGQIAPKTGLFLRGITTADYDGDVSHFGLADVSYNIVDGLDAVAEVQLASGMGVVPRVGAQYFGKFGDVSIYTLATVKAMENPDGEFVVNLGYTPKLTEEVRLLTNLENLTSVGAEGHQFSTQKVRTGLTFQEKYQVGAGIDLTELGPKGELTYSAGGFVGLKF